MRIADYDALLADQAARRERGDVKQLGIGVCLYVEVTGGAGGEFSEVEIHDDGSATLKAGTSAHGQGHATAYSSIVSDRLGIPLEKIRFVQSDTALVARGGGTGGSRSLQLGGSSVFETAQLDGRPGQGPRRRDARGVARRHRDRDGRPRRRDRRARQGAHVGRARGRREGEG